MVEPQCTNRTLQRYGLIMGLPLIPRRVKSVIAVGVANIVCCKRKRNGPPLERRFDVDNAGGNETANLSV